MFSPTRRKTSLFSRTDRQTDRQTEGEYPSIERERNQLTINNAQMVVS